MTAGRYSRPSPLHRRGLQHSQTPLRTRLSEPRAIRGSPRPATCQNRRLKLSTIKGALQNEDKVAAIDTLKNEVIATSPVGQAPQALVYVPNAVPAASGATNSATSNLQPLGVAGQAAQLWLAPPGAKQGGKTPTRVSLPDQR